MCSICGCNKSNTVDWSLCQHPEILRMGRPRGRGQAHLMDVARDATHVLGCDGDAIYPQLPGDIAAARSARQDVQ